MKLKFIAKDLFIEMVYSSPCNTEDFQIYDINTHINKFIKVLATDDDP